MNAEFLGLTLLMCKLLKTAGSFVNIGPNIRTFSVAEFFADELKLAGQYRGTHGLVRTVGQSSVITLAGEPCEFDFPEKQSDASHIEFIFFRDGGYSYLDKNEWIKLEAQLVVVSDGFFGKLRLEGNWKILVVRLPKEAAESLTPNRPRQIEAFKQVSILERAMYAFASALMNEQGEVSAVEVYALEQLLLEMGGASMLDRLGGGWVQGAPHAVMLDRAKAVIAQQSADPQLTPAVVAQEVNSSLRQLQTIFSEAGTSLAAEIRARRAYSARILLRESRYDVLTIDQIAERTGFGTVTSMRRALTVIYGLGPRDIRRKRD